MAATPKPALRNGSIISCNSARPTGATNDRLSGRSSAKRFHGARGRQPTGRDREAHQRRSDQQPGPLPQPAVPQHVEYEQEGGGEMAAVAAVGPT